MTFRQYIQYQSCFYSLCSPPHRQDSGKALDPHPQVQHTACPKVIYETQQETHSMDILHCRVTWCHTLQEARTIRSPNSRQVSKKNTQGNYIAA